MRIKTKDSNCIIGTFSFFIVVFCCFCTVNNILYSQWQPDVRLTIDPAMSVTAGGNSWAVAANGNLVHVVWHDDRNGNWEIYYKRSSTGGLNWGNDIRLTNNIETSFYPSITVSGMYVHIIWDENRDGNREIYYKRSTDRGLSWGSDIRLTNDSNDSYSPSLTAMGSIVHIVWEDTHNGLFQNNEIYYKRSTDNGLNWGADTRITDDSIGSGNPSVSTSDSYVHIVWEEWYNDGNVEIHYKRSNNFGNSWESEKRLTFDNAVSVIPSIYTIGQNIHIVWMDERNGNREIYYKRSVNRGLNWDLDTRLTNDTAVSEYPNITGCGNNVHVVWQDMRDSRYQIYYKQSDNGGVNWGTDTRLTLNSGIQWYPSVGVSGTSLHVCWTDTRAGNYEIFYKRNPTGNISPTYTISGRVTYQDNGQPVNQGLVKAIRYDKVTNNIINVDSTNILPGGYYSLPSVPPETTYIMYYPNDEGMPTYVPTYYRSTIDWQQADKIYPTQNLTDINGQVIRINNNSSSNLYIRGKCYTNNELPLSPLSDAIIYAKISNDFINFGISDSSGSYTSYKLLPGNYTLYAFRIGHENLLRNVTLSNNNLDSISFYFDPPIGINQINQTIPLQINLYQNYPNPFNPATKITFDIPGQLGISGKGISNILTELIIYDVLGKETAILVHEQLQPGTYEVIWDAGDYPTGVYFYKLKIGEYLQSKKMLLIK